MFKLEYKALMAIAFATFAKPSNFSLHEVLNKSLSLARNKMNPTFNEIPVVTFTTLIDIVNCEEAVGDNPDLITIDRWDLSKIFYDTRTILDKQGYDTNPMNNYEKRKDIHNAVADICEELGVKSQLGYLQQHYTNAIVSHRRYGN